MPKTVIKGYTLPSGLYYPFLNFQDLNQIKKQEFFYKNDLFNSFFITFIKRKSKTISNNALIEILNTTFLAELV